mmetsp:Transcript_1595/g.5137  ORF Transcript_1595/g.5137 Transcript_1595/m.5137 type:complete len:221 (-) Transcript_1595:119-781(-)
MRSTRSSADPAAPTPPLVHASGRGLGSRAEKEGGGPGLVREKLVSCRSSFSRTSSRSERRAAVGAAVLAPADRAPLAPLRRCITPLGVASGAVLAFSFREAGLAPKGLLTTPPPSRRLVAVAVAAAAGRARRRSSSFAARGSPTSRRRATWFSCRAGCQRRRRARYKSSCCARRRGSPPRRSRAARRAGPSGWRSDSESGSLVWSRTVCPPKAKPKQALS